MGAKHSLEDDLITFKLTSKQMLRSSAKCLKNQSAANAKALKAMKDGNIEGARIYANNAIREKTQSLNFLKLASRIDAVSSRLETAIRMQQVNAAMGQTVQGMSNAMKSMDADKITRTMEQFEKNFEDMEVRSGVMNDTMEKSSTMTTPPEQVDLLLQQLADEAGLQIAGQLDAAGPVGNKVPAAQQAETIDEDDLESRLKALRNA